MKIIILRQAIVMLLTLLIACACTIAADSSSAGQTSKHDAGDLAKKTQNPVADLISLPFQYNLNFETGPKAKTQGILNIQPVIPFNLNDDWNFIARPIIPLLNQPPFTDAQDREYGIGNIQFQGFFSPREKVNDWIVGLGPIFEFPTNSNDQLGVDNWSAGPAFVALKMQGPWVYGSLVTQLWSYSADDPETNKMLIQPFLNYNMKDGWYLTSSPIITADWTADSSNQWTIPIGGGIGKVFHVGKQAMNAQTQAFYNVETPRSGADWGLRFQLQFLFPK